MTPPPRRLALRFCCGSVFLRIRKMKIMKKKNTAVRQSLSGSSTSVARSSQPSVLRPPSSAGRSSVSSWLQAVRLPGHFSRALHQRHRSLSRERLLLFIQQRIPRQWAAVECVGQWVWVHVSRSLLELERAQLFELGFHYSPRRRAWQHPCGVPSSPSREPFCRFRPAWVS